MAVDFRSAQKASEVARVLDLLEQSLGRDSAEYFALLYDLPSHRREWIQVAVDDSDGVVGVLDMMPRQMRMGMSVWSVATVTMAATAQGQPASVVEGLIERAVTYAESQGCVAATVLGDPRTYAKLGFVPVRPSYATGVPVPNVPESGSAVVARPFQESDIERVAEFQERQTRQRPWSLVRDNVWWDWQRQLWKGDEELCAWRFFASSADFVIAELGGAISGYARLQTPKDEKFVLCTEVEVERNAPDVAVALLKRMRDRAVAAERTLLRFPAPRTIPFMAQIFDVASHHTVRPAAASMMRIIDLRAALVGLRDELTTRVQASRFLTHSGRLVAGVGQNEVALHFEAGRLAEVADAASEDEGVEIAEKAAAQMLAGYRSVDELRAAGQIEGPEEDIELLAALFPVGEPFTWGADLLY